MNIILLGIFIVRYASAVCDNSGQVTLSSQFDNYTSAKKLTLAQESSLLLLYKTLTNISDYSISLSSFSFYMNDEPRCNTDEIQIGSFNANNNIWFCFDDFYMMTCNDVWELIIKCGTYIQFHKPFNPNILLSVKLNQVNWITIYNNTNITNILPDGLCSGTYHVWFVYYSRGGKFIRSVNTIFIAYPSCTC